MVWCIILYNEISPSVLNYETTMSFILANAQNLSFKKIDKFKKMTQRLVEC